MRLGGLMPCATRERGDICNLASWTAIFFIFYLWMNVFNTARGGCGLEYHNPRSSRTSNLNTHKCKSYIRCYRRLARPRGDESGGHGHSDR